MKIYASSLAALTGVASAIDHNHRRGPYAGERFLDVEPTDLDGPSGNLSLSMAAAASAKGGGGHEAHPLSKSGKSKSSKNNSPLTGRVSASEVHFLHPLSLRFKASTNLASPNFNSLVFQYIGIDTDDATSQVWK